MNSGRISEIKAASNLSEIVKDFGVSLKTRRGKCPLCESSSNSFSVKDDYFNCFKCSASGDVVEFVQQSQGLSFIESMKFLGTRAGISTEQSITKTAGNEPKAAAKMYIDEVRRLNIPQDWYEQETYGYGNNHSATIRFQIDNGVYWERIIDAHKFDRKANFKGSYKGLSWQAPGQTVNKGESVYITEGIFDAIALSTALGVKTISAMSTSNFPVKTIEKYKNKNITWCLALDHGYAGKQALIKWTKLLSEMKQQFQTYYPGNDKDWNDLYKQGVLNSQLMRSSYFRGQKIISKTVQERFAWHIVQARVEQRWLAKSEVMTFNNCYYKCGIDEKSIGSESEDLHTAVSAGDYLEAISLLSAFIKVARISTATASLLYTQIDKVDNTHSYYFSVGVRGVKSKTKIEFSSMMIGDGNAFNQAMLKKVGQATFSGDSKDMKQIQDNWFAKRKPTVDTIRHMGYSAAHKAYVFTNFGYQNGKHYKTNKHDYINIGNTSVKTAFAGWDVPNKSTLEVKWLDDFLLAGGNNALTGLAFWLMSLFAQQIRGVHGTIPFWEYTGVGGSGKSTIIEFLWKLLGRDSYEGEDPEKLRPAALARTFMQASNIPVVLLEGDRDESNHRKKFSMDHIKTLFRGQSPYGRAIFNNGIETDNEPFLGTLVVSQNAPVNGPMQIISRFVTCTATKEGFNNDTYMATNRIKALKTSDCVNFLHKALGLETEIIACYKDNYKKYLNYLLTHDKITEVRIAETHAQVMAFGRALQLVNNDLSDDTLKDWNQFMLNQAISQQQSCAADIPIVAQFWDIFHTYDEKIINEKSLVEHTDHNLNHYCEKGRIAINLNLFKQFSEEKRQQIDINALQRTLRDSKRHKFIETKKVNSKIKHKVLHCWIFEGEK